MTRKLALGLALVATAVTPVAPVTATPSPASLPLSLVVDLTLPGGASRVVVDLATRRQTLTLPLPPDTDVLAFEPTLQRLYTASETGTVAVFAVAVDHSVNEMGRGFLGPNAHTVAVDPLTHRVYFPLENLSEHPVLRIMAARAPASPSD